MLETNFSCTEACTRIAGHSTLSRNRPSVALPYKEAVTAVLVTTNRPSARKLSEMGTLTIVFHARHSKEQDLRS